MNIFSWVAQGLFLTVYLIYFTADKGIKKKKEINLMIYSISKKTKRLVTAGLPVRRGDTIFTECSADQQATPDHKTSDTFFFWALACDKCGSDPCQSSCERHPGPDRPRAGAASPAPLFPTRPAARQQDLWFWDFVPPAP